MLKFHSKEDFNIFLIEVKKFNLRHEIDEENVPLELYEAFIQGRRTLIPHLKDYRKKSAGKQNWRHNRYKMLKGIRKFHKSTSGKRFHRNLGRYLATRLNKNESQNTVILLNTLKALSSVKTHYWIEREYYHSVDEQVDFEIFGEDSLLPMLENIETCLLEARELNDEMQDFLIAIVQPYALIQEIALQFDKEISEVQEISDKIYASSNMNESCAFLLYYRKIISELDKG